jgi:hypothetical protein
MDPVNGGAYTYTPQAHALMIVGHMGYPHLLHGESQQRRNDLRSALPHR